eukprot:9408955-Pyramimonas_sp.AAC.1
MVINWLQPHPPTPYQHDHLCHPPTSSSLSPSSSAPFSFSWAVLELRYSGTARKPNTSKYALGNEWEGPLGTPSGSLLRPH